jgi:TRAP-type C4-dicarboxylate transport system permease large subunit
MLPFYAAMLVALLLVTYVEPVTLLLPDLWQQWFPSAAG